MDDKPLHVQVAEVLGWIDLRQENGMDRYSWTGWHAPMEVGKRERVPDFEHDWSATGPLIEKHVTGLVHFGPEFGGYWQALQYNLAANGEIPLLAVCNLILGLKEAGKLVE